MSCKEGYGGKEEGRVTTGEGHDETKGGFKQRQPGENAGKSAMFIYEMRMDPGLGRLDHVLRTPYSVFSSVVLEQVARSKGGVSFQHRLNNCPSSQQDYGTGKLG